jgi:hypothetical protein
MKQCFALVFAASFLFLVGCDRKPAPLKEGVIWKVEWESANLWTGLYREKTPSNTNPMFTGQYGVDMYGALYPGFLELRQVGSRDSHSQIIPLNQIRRLEFGDGGISFSKP